MKIVSVEYNSIAKKKKNQQKNGELEYIVSQRKKAAVMLRERVIAKGFLAGHMKG